MWKKIGAINNNSNDNKSSRSRDQNNQYQPFSQMSKIRLSESQIGYEQSQYFCANYLSKKKSPQAKYLSQTRIKTEKQLNKLYADNTEKYKQTTLKKKIKTQSFQNMKNRISQLQIFQDNQENSPDTPQIETDENQFLQKNRSSTSIEFQQHTLRHYGSSPQLKSFNSDLIIHPQKQVKQKKPNHKINQTTQKIANLKQEYKELKKQVKDQIKNFQQDFIKIKSAINEKMKKQIKKQQRKNEQNKQQNKKMQFSKKDADDIMQKTTQFYNKLKGLDKKKTQLYEKYKLIKGK